MELQVFVFLLICILTNALSYDDDFLKEMDRVHQFAGHENTCKEPTFNNEFKMNLMSSVCNKPTPTLVKLFPESPEYTYVPSAVIVNRCHGMCSAELSCMATESKMVPYSVRRHANSGEQECGQVMVEEHIRCKCKCAKTEKHCNKFQMYNQSECMCNCMNMDMKAECEKSDRLWNQRTCECNCRHKDECSTGNIWIEPLCKCMPYHEK